MSKRSRDQFYKAELAATVVVSLAVVVLILSARLSYKEIEDYRYRKEVKYQSGLAEVLEDRWAGNGYDPSFAELATWIVWIAVNDNEGRGETFWTGFIEAESTGNPTAKGDGGESRGTGSIKRETLADHCYRTKRKVPKRAEVSLYNPLFNIKIMITEIEFLARQYSSTVDDEPYGPIEDSEDFPLAWACLAYNSGPGKAAEMRRRGVKPRFTFYKKVRQRTAEIESDLDNLNTGG